MADELDPIAVARRLAWLREHFVAETVEEARARFERERPARAETFEEGVARRLAETWMCCLLHPRSVFVDFLLSDP
jgi:hypothetical protein